MGKQDTRWLSVVAAIAGGFAVVSELTYRGTSTLSPILMALGIGIVALAVADLIRQSR